MDKLKRKAESMIDVWKYKEVVEEAIPLDAISNQSDHIYAEITDGGPPTLPPRADTPTPTSYPPYPSVDVLRKRRPSLQDF